MLIFSILFLLLSNAVTLRRDKSILFSRVAIIVLLYSSLLAITSLYINCFSNGISLFGGLFHTTSITQIFHIFIFLISVIILQLILNKMGEQFKIIEYPLILLFIITGAIILVSTSDLVSIFLSIGLESYGLYLLSTLYRYSVLTSLGIISFIGDTFSSLSLGIKIIILIRLYFLIYNMSLGLWDYTLHAAPGPMDISSLLNPVSTSIGSGSGTGGSNQSPGPPTGGDAAGANSENNALMDSIKTKVRLQRQEFPWNTLKSIYYTGYSQAATFTEAEENFLASKIREDGEGARPYAVLNRINARSGARVPRVVRLRADQMVPTGLCDDVRPTRIFIEFLDKY